MIRTLMGSLLALIVWRVHPRFQRVFQTYDRLNGMVQENVRGIRVVKSFCMEDRQIRDF